MADPREKWDMWFTRYYPFTTEGGRIGLMSCRICGAAVILGDSDQKSPEAHIHFHGEQGDLDPDLGVDHA